MIFGFFDLLKFIYFEKATKYMNFTWCLSAWVTNHAKNMGNKCIRGILINISFLSVSVLQKKILVLAVYKSIMCLQDFLDGQIYLFCNQKPEIFSQMLWYVCYKRPQAKNMIMSCLVITFFFSLINLLLM